MARSDPPDYSWESTFENGLFYIHNWHTNHKFRAVIGLSEMSVYLTPVRSVHLSLPSIRRITGILHFLTDLKMMFVRVDAKEANVLSCVGPLLGTSSATRIASEADSDIVPLPVISESGRRNTAKDFNGFPMMSSQSEASVSLSAPFFNFCPPLANAALPQLTESQGKKKERRSLTPMTDRQCALCRRVFGNASMMRRHMITHSTVPGFTCEMCGKGFKYRWNWKSHMRSKCPRLHLHQVAPNPSPETQPAITAHSPIASGLTDFHLKEELPDA